MKPIQMLAACSLLMSGIANAAPHYNGTVKGEIDGKKLDVKVVCERSKLGKMDSLSARPGPGMEIDAKDRKGDGVAVSVSGHMSQPAAAFTMLVGWQGVQVRRKARPEGDGHGLVPQGAFQARAQQARTNRLRRGFDA